MSNLLSAAIPPVSREFALELQRTFKPMAVAPGFDRDKLMQSVGEQRVVEYILRHSVNRSRPSETIQEEAAAIVKPKKNIWSMFSNRVN